ncbi:serine/threonine protein kinase, partial [Acinetobacter baumannii]
AMGAVYLAHDPQRAAPVALKTLALGREFEGPDLAEARARFFREADLAGRLDHPGIVRIFDAGESDGLAYMAMELVHG